jgi:hypothetical protein
MIKIKLYCLCVIGMALFSLIQNATATNSYYESNHNNELINHNKINFPNKQTLSNTAKNRPDKKTFDSFTIQSSYLINTPGQNWNYSTFNLEWMQSISRIADFGGKKIDDFFPNGGLYAGIARMTYYIGAVFAKEYLAPSTPYHEWGHLSRFRALGVPSKMYVGREPQPIYNGTNNFFYYWIKYEVKQGGGHVRPNDSYPYHLAANSSSGSAVDAIVSGAGVNNESLLAERLDENLFINRQLSVFQFVQAIDLRLPIRWYNLSYGDIHSTAFSYLNDGVVGSFTGKNPNSDDVESLVSRLKSNNCISLLSGSNIAGIIGIYKYVTTGNSKYEPLTLKGFRIPDLTNYITSRGLTTKFSSGYEYSDDLKFLFGYERVTVGLSRNEYELGVYKKLQDWEGLAKTSFSNDAINIGLTLNRYFGDHFKIGLQANMWDSRSLLGERNTLNFIKNKTYEASIGLSYLY